MILVDDNDDIDDDNNEKEKFNFFITLTIKNSVFYYMKPHSPLLTRQVFGRIRCLHRQD